jgi:hypothetical protein
VSGVAWARTPDRRTWRADAGGRVLTASRLSNGLWAATVDDGGPVGQSPEFGGRLAAQRWAERRAGGAE